jgi:CheY-like chemotaxis protein
MVHGFGRSLVSLVVLAIAGGAAAQDTTETFKEAVRLLRLNKDSEARDKLREVLNADPSAEDAFKLWRETDQRIWQLLLSKEGDIGKMARSLANRAMVARKPWALDPEKVNELVKKALSDDYGDRREATQELAAEHGERGAAAFFEALGNPDNANAQTLAILALQGMGRSAVNPLLACLQSDSDVLRRNAAAALQYIGDGRAKADLKRLAETDKNTSVKEVATKALERMVKTNASAHDLFVKKTNDYLAGSPEVMEQGDLEEVVWSIKDGKLVGTPVPPALYPMEMAKEAAYQALALNPSSDAAFVALTRAYVHEHLANQEALASRPEDEAIKTTAENLADLKVTVLGAGPRYLREAVATDLKLSMIPAAVAGIRLLAKVENASTLAESTLPGALDHTDKRVQYAAALALAELDPKGQFPGHERVVDALGKAVLEQSVRIVKFIDSDEKNRGIAREASARDRGLIIDADSKSGIEGIESLRYFSNVDAVVVNSNLQDITAQDVVREIRANPMTASTKVLLVTANKAEDEKAFGDKVIYIEGPVTRDALKQKIEEALKDVELPGPQKRADEISTKAAEALASLDASRFNLGRVSEDLVKAAAREDKVAIPALGALGNGAGPGVLDQVIAIAADETKSQPARVAAGTAAGDILARSKEAPSTGSKRCSPSPRARPTSRSARPPCGRSARRPSSPASARE